FLILCFIFFFFFFFQAEDGIRDRNVTEFRRVLFRSDATRADPQPTKPNPRAVHCADGGGAGGWFCADQYGGYGGRAQDNRGRARSEERRVGKECRSRWGEDRERKKERGSEGCGKQRR